MRRQFLAASFFMKISTMNKIIVTLTSWTKRIGNVSMVVKSLLEQDIEADIIQINLSEDEFKKVINIRQQKKEGSAALVMTLCQRCRRDFLADPTSVVKRMDPFSVQETQCDFCQIRNGHIYIVYKRKLYGRNKK